MKAETAGVVETETEEAGVVVKVEVAEVAALMKAEVAALMKAEDVEVMVFSEESDPVVV